MLMKILSLYGMDGKIFQEQLKYWRTRRKLSQENLGAALGVTQGLISQWESGETEPPLSRIFELAEALNCRPADLVEHTPEEIDALLTIWKSLKPIAKKQSLQLMEVLRATATE